MMMRNYDSVGTPRNSSFQPDDNYRRHHTRVTRSALTTLGNEVFNVQNGNNTPRHHGAHETCFARFSPTLIKRPSIFQLQEIRRESLARKNCYCREECQFPGLQLKVQPLDVVGLVRCPILEHAPLHEVVDIINQWIFDRDVPLTFKRVHGAEWIGYIFDRSEHCEICIELIRLKGDGTVVLVFNRLDGSGFVAVKAYNELCKRLFDSDCIEEIPGHDEEDSSDMSYSSDEEEDLEEEFQDYVVVDHDGMDNDRSDNEEKSVSEYLQLCKDDRLVATWVSLLKHSRNITDILSVVSLISHNSEILPNVEVMRRNPDLIACLLHVLKEQSVGDCRCFPIIRYCVKAIENILEKLEDDDLTWEGTETLLEVMIYWSTKRSGFSWKNPVTYSPEIQAIVSRCVRMIITRKYEKKEQGSFALRDVIDEVEAIAQEDGTLQDVKGDLDCFLQLLNDMNSNTS